MKLVRHTLQRITRSLNHLLPPMDRSVSTLLDDLDARSLLKETFIVMGNEFGRTPKDFAFDVAPFFVGD